MHKSILLVAIYSSSLWAEADLNPAIYNSASTSTGATATRETGGSATPSVPVMNSTINPGSGQGQQSQNGGAGANAAAGSALMASGAAMMANPATQAAGAALMAMGMLAMMQSGADKKAAGESGATGMASNTTGTGTNAPTAEPQGTSGFVDARIKEAQSKLAAAGYKMTATGLTRPNGSVVPASSFNSPAAMAAAGIPQAAIDESQKILAQHDGPMNVARVSSVGLNSGGGGGSGVPEGETESSSSAETTPGSNPFDTSAAQRAALVGGKTVNFDGEPIGVRGQNIFDMVHNCYQKKRVGQHFIEEETSVSVRAPASVRRKK